MWIILSSHKNQRDVFLIVTFRKPQRRQVTLWFRAAVLKVEVKDNDQGSRCL